MSWLPGMETGAVSDASGDDWYTPPWLLAWLPPIALDPCYAEGSAVKAAATLDLRRGDDGLTQAWECECCCNPDATPVGLCHEELYKMQTREAGDHGIFPNQPAHDKWPGLMVSRLQTASSEREDGTAPIGSGGSIEGQRGKSSPSKLRKGQGDAQTVRRRDHRTVTASSDAPGSAIQLESARLGALQDGVGQRLRVLRHPRSGVAERTCSGPRGAAISSGLSGNGAEQYGSGVCSVQCEQGVFAAGRMVGVERENGQTCESCGLPFVNRGIVFVNFPFSQASAWLAKCRQESRRLNRVVVALAPAFAGDGPWHANVWGEAQLVGFLAGRVGFFDGSGRTETKGRGHALILYGRGQPCREVAQHIALAAATHPRAPFWTFARFSAVATQPWLGV